MVIQWIIYSKDNLFTFSPVTELGFIGNLPLFPTFRSSISGTHLAVQWLGLHAPTAGGMGLIPSQVTKIPHAAQRDINE